MTSGVESIGNNQVKTYIEHDDVYSESTVSTFSLGYPIYIMRMDSVSSNSMMTYLRSLKMYSGDTLLFDGIPCYRISDNKTGMYDVVSQTFFTNNGTGEFVIGNVVA